MTLTQSAQADAPVDPKVLRAAALISLATVLTMRETSGQSLRVTDRLDPKLETVTVR